MWKMCSACRHRELHLSRASLDSSAFANAMSSLHLCSPDAQDFPSLRTAAVRDQSSYQHQDMGTARPSLDLSDSPDSPEDAAFSTYPSQQCKPTIPPDFCCPISMDIMRDPVMVATGQSYDRPCIERWIHSGKRTCPKSGVRLRHTELTPNIALRSIIHVRTSRSLACAIASAISLCSGLLQY